MIDIEAFRESLKPPTLSDSRKYDRAPASVVASIDRFVEHRIAPGSFVRAVLSNDLAGAFGTADESSLRGLRDIMLYIHWEVPARCHGSESKVQKWLQGHG